MLVLFAATALFSKAIGAEEGLLVPAPRLMIPKAFVTADELANPGLYHPRYSWSFTPSPAVYGPPPAGVIRPGEFEPMDSVVIAVMNYGPDFMDMWVDMLDVYSQAGFTWIVATGNDKTQIQALIDAAEITDGSYSYLNYPINSIWIRDYGPEFAVGPDGTRYIADAFYEGRPLDDLVPGLMGAGDWMNSDGTPVEVFAHDHMLSGGNIMSDGAGTCFFSKILYGYEKPAGWSDEDVDALFQEYLGCEQIVALNSICLDGTGHIDLYAKLLSPTAMLLGEYPPDTHFDGTVQSADTGHCGSNYPNDYQDQEDNLAAIEATSNLDGDPWVVTRLPMPEPYQDGEWWVYRSYMNSQIFNNWVAMPSYYDPHGETTQDLLDLEALAIAAYEQALPGVNVVAIDSDHIIPLAGAMHCITHEIPVEAGGGWEPPATYCGDGVMNNEEDCDGADLGDASCADFGLAGDTLACLGDCTLDTSECASADCGDGVVGEGEECDPCAPSQAACSEYDLGAGEVGCNPDCTINTLNCDEATKCDALAAMVPGLVCCPDPAPADCEDASWNWSPEDSFYGCCTGDLTETIYCYNGYVRQDCSGWCQYLPDDDYVDCGGGEMPEAAAPDIDCDIDGDADTDTDTGALAGSGGGDGGCGCSAAGGSPGGLLAAMLGVL
jgi:agmatine/peptidylarginine deiminase